MRVSAALACTDTRAAHHAGQRPFEVVYFRIPHPRGRPRRRRRWKGSSGRGTSDGAGRVREEIPKAYDRLSGISLASKALLTQRYSVSRVIRSRLGAHIIARVSRRAIGNRATANLTSASSYHAVILAYLQRHGSVHTQGTRRNEEEEPYTVREGISQSTRPDIEQSALLPLTDLR